MPLFEILMPEVPAPVLELHLLEAVHVEHPGEGREPVVLEENWQDLFFKLLCALDCEPIAVV